MLIATASMPPNADGLCPQGPPGPPPPLLPKPGKDNLRLQRLLRKLARKRSTGGGPAAPPGTFRSSLSPVSEASHDPEPAGRGPAEAPPAVATLSHTPVTHHVASPLRKSTLSFSFSQRRGLAAPSSALGLPHSAPAPGPTWAPGGFAHIPAPTAGAARSRQAQPLPGPPPRAGTPELPQGGPDGGLGGQDGDTAPRPARSPARHPRGPHPPPSRGGPRWQALAGGGPCAQAAPRPPGLGTQGGQAPGRGAHRPHLSLAGTLASQASPCGPRG